MFGRQREAGKQASRQLDVASLLMFSSDGMSRTSHVTLRGGTWYVHGGPASRIRGNREKRGACARDHFPCVCRCVCVCGRLSRSDALCSALTRRLSESRISRHQKTALSTPRPAIAFLVRDATGHEKGSRGRNGQSPARRVAGKYRKKSDASQEKKYKK